MKAGDFLTADRCAIHGFASLHLMTLDENGSGSRYRLLGPKACCPKHGEVMRWRLTDELRTKLCERIQPATPTQSAFSDLSVQD